MLTPTWDAAIRASEAIRKHFEMLAQESLRRLAEVVAELVDRSVERRSGAITVTAALRAGAIRGEVADHGELVPFEVPV